MGLSSSQARLLNLTGRMHQIEYKAAKLEAQKLQMANESSRVYEDYQNALEATKIQMKSLNTDGSITFKDISSYDDFNQAGYYLAYDTGASQGLTTYIEGEFSLLCSDMGINNFGTSNFETLLTNIINSGEVVIIKKRSDGSTPNGNDADFADYQVSVSTDTGLQEVSNEANLRKAEAKYEADMKRIDNKDKKYDYDLAALDNERNAIKQEMETLKTVAKDNVDRTFKLFS